MTYALYEALRLVHEEGLEACFARHMRNHQALKAGLAALGIDYTAASRPSTADAQRGAHSRGRR